MEDWKRDFEWLRVRHQVKDMMGYDKLPDFQAMLFLIGIQELGAWDQPFTKEEKQDLMHIATCRLLEPDGYYQFVGRDHDGWPHYRKERGFNIAGLDNQEAYLIEKVIAYFDTLEEESASNVIDDAGR